MPKKKQKKVAAKRELEDKPIKAPHYIYSEDGDEAEERRSRNRRLRHTARNLFSAMRESRKRYDWEWLTRDLYRRGYQFSSYNTQTKTVVLSNSGSVRIPINLLWSQMRVIRNQVTSFRPKWEVLPTGKSEQSRTNARYSGKLLDYYYDRLNLRKMIKETVTQGLLYSVGGPWQVMFDPDADEGRGEVRIWLIDTFDFFVDMNATSMEDAEFCAKAIRKPLDEVKHDPNYTFYRTVEKGDQRQAESEYKQFLLQALKYQQQYSNNDNETVILKEFWMKERVNKDNMDELKAELAENEQKNDNLREGEVLMRVVTYLDMVEDPLRVQLLRRSDFPFEVYQADINPVEFYGESWAKHVIPMNRVLNALESSIFQYHYKYAKGRFVIDKNSGVRIINNEHGSIVEKNQGAEVRPLDFAQLPGTYINQIENMRRYIEDIGGAHDISLGRIPTGVKSGVGLAELKQADSTNQNDLVDNLEDFLIRVAKKMLREISEHYNVPRVIKALGKSGDPEHFAIIGAEEGDKRKKKNEVRIGVDTLDLAHIGKDNEINVKVGSWLAYTKTAQQEKLQQLFEAGVIDQKTFLEHLEFADVQSIVERTREQSIMEKMADVPAAGAGGVTDIEIAEQENIMMTQEGRRDVEPLPEDAHIIHIAIHQDYADNELVAEHIEKHKSMMRQSRSGENVSSRQPQQPMGMPEGGMPMETPPPAPGLMGGPQMPPMPGMPMGGMPAGGMPDEQAIIQALEMGMA